MTLRKVCRYAYMSERGQNVRLNNESANLTLLLWEAKHNHDWVLPKVDTSKIQVRSFIFKLPIKNRFRSENWKCFPDRITVSFWVSTSREGGRFTPGKVVYFFIYGFF